MKCRICLAPNDKFVTRKRDNPRDWSTSLNLWRCRTSEFTPPRKVVLNTDLVCQCCQELPK